MINENCPLCGSTSFKVIYDVTNPTAHAGIGLPGVVKECRKCNMIFKTYDVKAENLYNDDYASSYLGIEDYSGESAISFFKDIVQSAYKRVNIPQPLLLDIGSGGGTMLDTAKLVGYTPTGVELSEKLAKKAEAKGYRVINKNISEVSFSEKFDTVTMMDIIEHLEDPNDILKAVKGVLKDKGELIVYTPNHNSPIVKIASLFYRLGIKSPVENIFACTHTCFFTTGTLKKVLEDSGYKVIETRHFNYDPSRPGQKVSLLAKIGVSVIEKLGGLFGLKGFRLVMFAQPK